MATATSEKTQAIERLREALPPGSTVATMLRHVTRSGMGRTIVPIITDENGDPWDISALVARAGVGTFDRDRGGVKMGGCGMDMGFALVYALARTMYPSGHPCTCDSGYGTSCPSNDHSNGDRDYTPHHHTDGGYALRQRWL